MYSSTFIFAAGPFDEAFHRLDEAIATAARALPGYLGEESWEDTRNGLVSNVYYWESLAALQALMQHPAHPRACLRSRRGSRWSAIGMSGCLGCAAWARAHASSRGIQSPDFAPTLRAAVFAGGLRRCSACG
jgi:heme-degrading monooxygenase HmoA